MILYMIALYSAWNDGDVHTEMFVFNPPYSHNSPYSLIHSFTTHPELWALFPGIQGHPGFKRELRRQRKRERDHRMW